MNRNESAGSSSEAATSNLSCSRGKTARRQSRHGVRGKRFATIGVGGWRAFWRLVSRCPEDALGEFWPIGGKWPPLPPLKSV